MINYDNFHYALTKLKKFMEEQDKLEAVLNVIAPSGTCVCEFGNEFLDDYINLLEHLVDDNSKWVSWFVFENDFGEKELDVIIDNKKYKITSDKVFYDICLINVKEEIQCQLAI